MPDDLTPHGGEALHQPPDRARIPAAPSDPHAEEAATRQQDIAARPALPDHPQIMAADIEDEEADPVVDTGPGIDDGQSEPPSVTRQPA